MLHPNYVELMDIVNKNVEEGEEPIINSRYSIVMATAKRARQIVDGADPMIDADPLMKPLSVAVNELWQDQIQITGTGSDEDDLSRIAMHTSAIAAVSEDDLEETLNARQQDEEASEDKDDISEDN